MVLVNENCKQNFTTGDFTVRCEREFNNCQRKQTFSLISDVRLTSSSTCIPINGTTSNGWCYRLTLMYKGTVIDTQTNLLTCSYSELRTLMGAGVSYELNSYQENGDDTVLHLTTATFSCTDSFSTLSGASQATCVNGQWVDGGVRSCLQVSTGNQAHTIVSCSQD